MRENNRKTVLLFVFYGIALSVCAAVRYLQYTAAIEIENGFFISGNGFLNSLYYILAALFSAGFLSAAIFAEKVKVSRLYPPVAAFGGVIAISCGLLYCYEVFESGFTAKSLVYVVAAVGFLYAGVNVFAKKRIHPSAGFAFLLLAVYYTISAASVFMGTVYIRNVSARLIVLLAYLLSAMFFLSAGKAFIRAESRLSAIITRACGCSAALLILSDGFARSFYYRTSENDIKRAVLSANNGFSLPGSAYLVQGTVILWLVYALSFKRKRNRKENR